MDSLISQCGGSVVGRSGGAAALSTTWLMSWVAWPMWRLEEAIQMGDCQFLTECGLARLGRSVSVHGRWCLMNASDVPVVSRALSAVLTVNVYVRG